MINLFEEISKVVSEAKTADSIHGLNCIMLANMDRDYTSVAEAVHCLAVDCSDCNTDCLCVSRKGTLVSKNEAVVLNTDVPDYVLDIYAAATGEDIRANVVLQLFNDVCHKTLSKRDIEHRIFTVDEKQLKTRRFKILRLALPHFGDERLTKLLGVFNSDLRVTVVDDDIPRNLPLIEKVVRNCFEQVVVNDTDYLGTHFAAKMFEDLYAICRQYAIDLSDYAIVPMEYGSMRKPKEIKHCIGSEDILKVYREFFPYSVFDTDVRKSIRVDDLRFQNLSNDDMADEIMLEFCRDQTCISQINARRDLFKLITSDSEVAGKFPLFKGNNKFMLLNEEDVARRLQ